MTESYQRRFDAEIGDSDYEMLLKVAGSDKSCRTVGKEVIMWLAGKVFDLEEGEDWGDIPINGGDITEHVCWLVQREVKRLKEDLYGIQ